MVSGTQSTIHPRNAARFFAAKAANLVTVFMLRAVPLRAAGIFSLERPMPST